MDLSPSADYFEAISKVYDALRWAETNTDAECVLITDILALKDTAALAVNETGRGEDKSKGREHLEALFDRLFRAASGKSA